MNLLSIEDNTEIQKNLMLTMLNFGRLNDAVLQMKALVDQKMINHEEVSKAFSSLYENYPLNLFDMISMDEVLRTMENASFG